MEILQNELQLKLSKEPLIMIMKDCRVVTFDDGDRMYDIRSMHNGTGKVEKFMWKVGDKNE